jgi:hypothetical protein
VALTQCAVSRFNFAAFCRFQRARVDYKPYFLQCTARYIMHVTYLQARVSSRCVRPACRCWLSNTATSHPHLAMVVPDPHAWSEMHTRFARCSLGRRMTDYLSLLPAAVTCHDTPRLCGYDLRCIGSVHSAGITRSVELQLH